ncbi:DiGeorge syndrome critical region protein 14 [Apophysomyces sp. BC1034]|nr:DiGeorge syndrome critical region protein 14 [Apophysomyces sp. BC1015]KAG0181428.1 DiGeorge syndrome critical region protein 14 [Apophysomyces sp. BC1021]KAG0191907.1 DiGeorge syndrome critical region protein 14 [Apophysomyces sp. BC1034]
MTSVTPVVLDEDTYTEAISHIIERDFFPHLAKLRPQETQQDRATPRSTERASQSQPITGSIPNPLHKASPFTSSTQPNVRLSKSEDNASFADLLEKANAKRKEKFKWIFDSSKQLRIGDQESHLKLIEAQDAKPGTWRFNAKNALMYFPEGPSQSILNDKESRAAPKAITYANTQLNRSVQPPGDMAPSDIAAQKGSLTPWHMLSGGADEASSSADFRGYNLVPSTPTLSPSRMGTPIMTWGSVEGTPMLIQGSETPGPQFSLPKVSRREELGMKLSERASRAYRKKTGERERVMRGTPRTGAGLMSPAAQHLLRRSNTPYPLGFDAALRSSYGASSSTRTPTRMPGATPTPLFRAGATPTFGTPLQKR